MEKNNNKQSNNKQGRRNFLKGTFAAGLGAATLGVGGSKLLKASNDNDVKEINRHKFAFSIREHDSMEDIYQIAPDYKRMRQRNTLYSRVGWDPDVHFGTKGRFVAFTAKWESMTPNPLVESGEPGFGKLEQALNGACYQGPKDTVGGSPLGSYNEGIFHDWDRFSNPEVKEKYRFKSPEEASKYIKRAAKFLGASDAGIAPYDERWIYDRWYNVGVALRVEGMDMAKNKTEEEEIAKFPFEVKSVIVTVHEMDKDALAAPGFLMDASAGLEYASMAEVGHKVSSFLNKLGYKAAPAGNDTSLSVPTAAQAGLGEQSRMGTLIHPKIGPGFRIQKIYTDLELKPDKPITFGVQEFCMKCKKCADACPGQAISWEDPTEKPTVDSISSHPGVKRWYQDNERCVAQFERFGTGCGMCMSVCPYNKPENWVHDIAKAVVGVPVGRDIARIMDDGFGYGKPEAEDVEKFWNKKD